MNNTSLSTPPVPVPAAKEPLLSFTELVVLSVLYVSIALVAIVGNVLIIVVFSKKRRLRTRTNYFIIGLATSDTLVGAVTIPLWMVNVCLLYMMRYKEWEAVYAVFSPLDILSGMLSILHLMTISLERLYAIAFPLRHRTSRACTNYVALAVLWTFAAGVASLSFFLKANQWKGTFMVYSALGFFVPFSIILVAYVSIYVIVKRRMHKSREHTHVARKESRTALTVFFLIVLFLFTWLPFFSLNLILYSCPSCTAVITANYYILLIFKALHYSGSALNPIVYSARMPEFRRPLKTLIRERRISETQSYYRKDSLASLRSLRRMSEARNASEYRLNSRKESVVSQQSRTQRIPSENSSPYSRKDSTVSVRSFQERKTSSYLSPYDSRKDSVFYEFPCQERKMSGHLSPNNHRKGSMVSERSFQGRKMSVHFAPHEPKKDSPVADNLTRQRKASGSVSRKDSVFSERSSASDHSSPCNPRKDSVFSERSNSSGHSSACNSRKDSMVFNDSFQEKMGAGFLSSATDSRARTTVSEKSFPGKVSIYLTSYADCKTDPATMTSLIRETYI